MQLVPRTKYDTTECNFLLHHAYSHLIFSFGWFFYFQFPKCRWQICYPSGAESTYKHSDTEWSSFHSSVELSKKLGADKSKEKEKIQREEWSGLVLRFKNDALIILSIIGVQLPFELAYAYIYESIGSDSMKWESF